jgi:YHS domain-containing protein
MKLVVSALAIVIGIGAVSVLAADHDHAAKSDTPATQPAQAGKPVNTKCPVSGDPIDPAITTVYQGKTIAFCCKDCIGDFNKNPEKYMKTLK